MRVITTTRAGSVPIDTNHGTVILRADYRNGNKQVKDYRAEVINRTKPLGYSAHFYRNTGYTSAGNNGFSLYSTYYWTDPRNHAENFNFTSRNSAYNKAYQKAMDEMTPIRGSAGVTLAQAGEAASMIEHRADQLLQLGRLYASKDVKGFVRYINESLMPTRAANNDLERKFKVIRKRELGKRRTTKVISRTRVSHWEKVKASGGDLGGLWLETWFGWLPTVADLQACAEVLCSPVMDQKIQTAAAYDYQWRYRHNYPGVGYTEIHAKGKGYVKIGFHVSVTNPNLYLLNSVGLLNPFLVGWDLIKFSWLVGWVGNFQQVMQSWTDMAGLQLKDSYVTDFLRMKTEDFGVGDDPEYGSHRQTGDLVITRRMVGSLPYPTLQLALPNRLSLTRGLTSLSLLAGFLSKS